MPRKIWNMDDFKFSPLELATAGAVIGVCSAVVVTAVVLLMKQGSRISKKAKR